MKPVKLTLISAALLGLSSMAHAGFNGAISDNTHRHVGESQVDAKFGWIVIHEKGYAGIGATGKERVDFKNLAKRSSWPFGVTRDGVHTRGSRHSTTSQYNFANVANQDVWFGEWYEGSRDSGYANRAVFYVGDNTGTTVPTSGVATYTVTGVNKFSGSNKLTATGSDVFTANFGTQTLTGTLSNSSLSVSVNANINASTAAFNGTAAATTGGTTTNGTSQGHFFGANASALAGIATFTNKDLDTAFGGSKN